MDRVLNGIDKGPAKAASWIFVGFFVLSVLGGLTSYGLPKPLDWLEAWLKVFQTVVAIVVGLKIALNITPLVKALGAQDKG